MLVSFADLSATLVARGCVGICPLTMISADLMHTGIRSANFCLISESPIAVVDRDVGRAFGKFLQLGFAAKLGKVFLMQAHAE